MDTPKKKTKKERKQKSTTHKTKIQEQYNNSKKQEYKNTHTENTKRDTANRQNTQSNEGRIEPRSRELSTVENGKTKGMSKMKISTLARK